MRRLNWTYSVTRQRSKKNTNANPLSFRSMARGQANNALWWRRKVNQGSCSYLVGVDIQAVPSSPQVIHPSTLWFRLPPFSSPQPIWFWNSSPIDLFVGSLKGGDVTFPSLSPTTGSDSTCLSVFLMAVSRPVLRATVLHDMALPPTWDAPTSSPFQLSCKK